MLKIYNTDKETNKITLTNYNQILMRSDLFYSI